MVGCVDYWPGLGKWVHIIYGVFVALMHDGGKYIHLGDWLLIVVVPLITFGGLAIAWKQAFIGGVVLIVEGLFLSFAYTLRTIVVGADFTVSFAVFGVSLLASGALFLLSWRERRRHSGA